METLADINRSDNVTVVVSLHQVDFALKYCSRVVALRDGHVMYDGPAAAVTYALLRGIYGNNNDLDFGTIYGAMLPPAAENRPEGELHACRPLLQSRSGRGALRGNLS